MPITNQVALGIKLIDNKITNTMKRLISVNAGIQKLLLSIAIVLLIAVSPMIVWAQAGPGQEKLLAEEVKKMQQQMRQQMGIDQNFEAPTGINLPSLSGKYATFSNDQSWSYVPDPFRDFNLLPNNSGQAAGDINADGNADFIMRGFPNGEPKTLVYYGGSTNIQPDQIVGRWLSPIGDINGDGYSDAVHHYEGEIHLGSNSGYQNSGGQLPPTGIYEFGPVQDFGLDQNIILPAGDLDGDGIDDAIHYIKSPNGTKDIAIYWGSDAGNVGQDIVVTVFNVNGPDFSRDITSFVLNAADFTGDDNNEIYVVGKNAAQSGQDVLRVLDISADRSTMTAVQDIDLTYGGGIPFVDYGLNVLDLNDDGFLDVYLSPLSKYNSGDNWVFTESNNSPGSYASDGVVIFVGVAVAAGDLDGDGLIDFFVGDPDNNNAPYIANGTATFSNEVLTLDTQLSFGSNPNWVWQYTTSYPYSYFGDLDGDGLDDTVLGVAWYETHETGYVKVMGDASGTPVIEDARASITDFNDQILESYNIGDVNGDGIDDFGLSRTTIRQIEVYYGGTAISQTPDIVLNAAFEADLGTSLAIGIDGGDFNGDGINDVVVSSNVGTQIKVFFGGTSMDGVADHIIDEDIHTENDTESTSYLVNTLGDINDDGIDDFGISSYFIGFVNSNDQFEHYNEYYVYFGGSSLPTTPDPTIVLDDTGANISAGWDATEIGDMNGDGITDFAVASQGGGPNGNGMVQVFFGNSSGSFSSPDLEMTVPQDAIDYIFQHGYALAGGDYNGDGYADLAVSNGYTPGGASNEDYNSHIFVYLGGDLPDAKADHYLKINPSSVGAEGSIVLNNGNIETVPDHDNNGVDELIAFPYFETNAVIFGGNLNENDQQTLVLEAPNPDFPLGGSDYRNAVGHFSGDSTVTVISQNNIASNADAAYRYHLGRPINISSVEDVSEDQGDWVRVSVDGYYMDALDADILGFDHWAVWLQDGGSWTNVGTVPAYTESGNYVDVHVPKTKPSEGADESTTYTFKVTALNKAGNSIAESDTMSGFATDNLAPAAVSGINAQHDEDEVMLSWNSITANDLQQYEVISGDEVIASSNSTNVTLPDADYEGLQQLAVRAWDIHANVGEASTTAIARFPMTLDYQVQQEWNLISLPLDAEAADIAALTDAANGTLYEYNGSYSSVETLEPGHGYWAKFSSADTYSVPGLPVATQTIELSKGWNLVSGIGASLEASQIQDPNGILIDGTLTGFNGGYTEAEVLSPGNGYWIRAAEAGTITLSVAGGTATESLNKSRSPLAELKQQLNALTVASAESYHSTLYFGEPLPKDVDPLSFSLPPQAPGSSFDARMAGNIGRYSEGRSVTVRLQQPNDSDHQFTVSLDLVESDRHQRYKIEERDGSTVLATHTVGADESITVSKSATTLKVSPAGQALAVDTPKEFALAPSYPNPFNPSTTIQYTLPEQVQVQLEVYNMVGQRVRRLLAGQAQEAGTHTIRFDASELSSGIYFVRLQAGSFQQIQKITLIK